MTLIAASLSRSKTTVAKTVSVGFVMVAAAVLSAQLYAAPATAPSVTATGRDSATLDAATEAALKDLDAKAGRIQDYTARFEQLKYTALLRKPLVSKGIVRVLGANVRWDTEVPDPAVLHADGQQVSLYYPKQKLVEVYPIDKRMSDLAASPLPRLDVLRKSFSFHPLSLGSLKADAGPLVDGPEKLALKLTPTDDFLKQHLSEVRVLLDQKSAFMLCVVTVDKEGDRTVIRFSDAQLNTGLKPQDVAFAPPADAKVSRPLDMGQRQ